MITRLKLIYVIVALETQAHIVAEAEKSWNIFRHVPGRYSRILSYQLRCSSIHILGGAWVSFRNTSLAAYKKIVPFFPLVIRLLKLLASYKPNTSVSLWRKQSISTAGLTMSVLLLLLIAVPFSQEVKWSSANSVYNVLKWWIFLIHVAYLSRLGKLHLKI